MLAAGSADTGGGGGAGGSKGAPPRSVPQLTYTAPASVANRTYVQPKPTAARADQPDTLNLAGLDVLHQSSAPVVDKVKDVFSDLFTSDVKKPAEPSLLQMASPGQSAMTPTQTRETQGISKPEGKKSVVEQRREELQKLKDEGAPRGWGTGNPANTLWPHLTKPQSDVYTDEAIERSKGLLHEAERDIREKALGDAASPFKKDGDIQVLTQAEYDAMTDKERAAVDFNTMLVRAVKRDKRLGDRYDYSNKEKELYDEAVDKMFGEDETSTTYAPETVALLKQIDFKDRSAELEDFLGLRAAITARDMNQWTRSPAAPELGEVAVDRVELSEGLAESTQEMEQALVKGNQMLATINQTALAERNEILDVYGGIAKEPVDVLGYGTGEADRSMQEVFQAMVDKSTNPSEILSQYQTQLDPADFKSFLSYVDSRTTNAEQWELELGKRESARSPEELRAAIGLDGQPAKQNQPAAQEQTAGQRRTPEPTPGNVTQTGGYY